jgi:hypothetical protein
MFSAIAWTWWLFMAAGGACSTCAPAQAASVMARNTPSVATPPFVL